MGSDPSVTGTRPVGSCPCCPPARLAVITGRLSERRALLANMLLMSVALELFLRGFCHGVGRAGGEDSVPQTHFTGGKKKGRCTGLPAVLRLSEHRASVPGTWVLGASSKPLSLGWPRLLALSPLAGCGPPSSCVPRPAIKTGGDLNKTSPGALLDATDQFSPFAPTDLLWRGLRHNPRCYTLSPAPSTGAEPSKTPPPLQGLFKSHLFQEVNPNCLSQKGRLFF